MNRNTKDRIIQASLRLFAKRGFSGVSTSDIAREVGITKAALYRHFDSKQAIFDGIVSKMQEYDMEYAREFNLPEGTFSEMPDRYRNIPIDEIKKFSKAMFRHWTEQEMPSNFRKMLTLEQFRSTETGNLYQQYLSSGPTGYMADIFCGITGDNENAFVLAYNFYAPMFLLYSVYDGAGDNQEEKARIIAAADAHIDGFFKENNFKKAAKGKKKNRNITIRREEEKDYRTVENLVRESFWNVYRPGCMEHYVLHCFRENKDFIPELDYVLELDGKIIGHVMYCRSEIRLDNGKILPSITLGPICIAPEYKRQGFGKILLDATIREAQKLGFGVIVIEGNINFYGKSGFTVAKEQGIRYADDPEAGYLLCLELRKGYIDGVKGTFADPQGYFVCQNDPQGFAEFEAGFPPKEKKKLPGQIFKQ